MKLNPDAQFASVLPASAGMIRARRLTAMSTKGAPRIRGDDPQYEAQCLWDKRCSPHPRG